mgnify:CR=1 FL=1
MMEIGSSSVAMASGPTCMVVLRSVWVVGVVFVAHSERFPDDPRQRVAHLVEHHAQGAFKPRIWKTFGLADAPSALAEITARRVVGKMVLTV